MVLCAKVPSTATTEKKGFFPATAVLSPPFISLPQKNVDGEKENEIVTKKSQRREAINCVSLSARREKKLF